MHCQNRRAGVFIVSSGFPSNNACPTQQTFYHNKRSDTSNGTLAAGREKQIFTTYPFLQKLWARTVKPKPLIQPNGGGCWWQPPFLMKQRTIMRKILADVSTKPPLAWIQSSSLSLQRWGRRLGLSLPFRLERSTLISVLGGTFSVVSLGGSKGVLCSSRMVSTCGGGGGRLCAPPMVHEEKGWSQQSRESLNHCTSLRDRTRRSLARVPRERGR